MAVDLNKYNTPAKKGVDLNKYNMPGIPADSPEAQQYHPVNRLKSKSVTSSEPGILEKIEGWIGTPTQPGEGIGAGLPTEFQTQTALLENALKGLVRFPPQMMQDVLQRGPIKAGAGLLKFPFDVATQAANMAGAQIPPSTQIGEVPIEQIQAPTGAEARQQAFEDPTPLLLALVPLLKARLGGKPTPAGLEPKAVIPERSTTPPIDINKMLESRPEPQISKKGQTQPLASMVTKRGKELSKGVDLNKINESSKVTPEQARQDIAQKTQGVAGETVPPKIVIGGEGKKIREFMAEKAKPKEPWEIEKAGLYDKYQKLTPNESISSLEVGKYGKFDIPITEEAVYFHGGKTLIDNFNIEKKTQTTLGGFSKYGFSFGPRKVAERYANDFFGKNGKITPVRIKRGKDLVLSSLEFEKLQHIVSEIDKGKKLTESQDIDLEIIFKNNNIKFKPESSLDPTEHPIRKIKEAGYSAIVKKTKPESLAEPEILILDNGKDRIITLISPEAPKAEPPATIPPKPPTKPVATTPAPGRPLALTNAGIDYMREIANKTPLEKGQRQTWEQAGEKAISEGLDQRAVEIAEKVIEEKRMIATEEHAGMVMKYNELRREYNQVTDDISKAVERGESIENNLQKRRDAIEAQIDRLDEAVKIGGTPLGQALNIRKMRLSDQPMDVLSLTKEATARWKRKPTEAERLELKKFADSHAGREKLIDELWKQEEGRELIKAKVEAERQFEYEQRKARRTKAKENIDVEIADILKQIEKKGFHTRLHSTPLDPEMAYLTGKLAAAYIRKGGITLAGVVDRVRMHIPEITERNVYDALNTRNPKYQAKLRKVETERLRLMKQQANYLAKLEDAAEGKLTPPKPGIGKTTTVVATTEEIKALKRTVSDLRAKLSDTIMESRRLEKAQEILDKLRDQLINQYREVKRAPRKPIPSEALKSIREKIAEVKKELRLRDSIADLEEQIRTDQFKTPKKVEAKPLPENIERQLIEQKRLKRRVADYLRNKEKTRGQKIISETVNTIKTLQATADISATLRQGLVESVAHPGIAGRAQVKALKAMFNTYTAEQIDMSIRQHPNHLIRERAGLQLTEVGADLLSKREEMFGSNVLRKISGLKHVVEASERHMTTYLNLLRVGVFDKFVEAYPNATTAELRAYADALNKITGRGDLGRAAGGKIGAALNVTLFAPKFTASRFQAPWTIKKYWSMPRVRNQIAKDFAKTIAAGAGILALAKLAGYAVNIDDPRNPDWGKIKVGNTTYDVWGGFLQPARMMARLLIYGTDRAGLTGQMKTDQEKYGIEPLDIIENFAEYKAGPAVNIPNQLLTGKSMVGEKLETPQDWALQNLTAFWLRDAYDAYQDAGFGKAAGVSLATIVGMGANTYELSEMKTRREIKRLYYREGKKEEAETMRREWNDKHPDQQIGTNLSDPLKDEKIRQIKAMYQKKGREAARDLLKKINKTYNWDIKEEDIQ